MLTVLMNGTNWRADHRRNHSYTLILMCRKSDWCERIYSLSRRHCNDDIYGHRCPHHPQHVHAHTNRHVRTHIHTHGLTCGACAAMMSLLHPINAKSGSNTNARAPAQWFLRKIQRSSSKKNTIEGGKCATCCVHARNTQNASRALAFSCAANKCNG